MRKIAKNAINQNKAKIIKIAKKVEKEKNAEKFRECKRAQKLA